MAKKTTITKATITKATKPKRVSRNLGRRAADDMLQGAERENAAWLIYGAMQLTKPGVDEIEAATGSDIATIRNWAAGYSVPSITVVDKLRRFFGARGVTLDFGGGTLSFSIKKAIAGGVTPRRLKL
jgi:hypothetical protein